MLNITIKLDSKSKFDLLLTAIDHLENDDRGMCKALAQDNNYSQARVLKIRADALKALRAEITGEKTP